MSHRPINTKKANRVRKFMRNTPDAYIDLVAWLKMHGHADTTGAAERLILDRRVRSESHVIGIAQGKRAKDNVRIKLLMGRQLTEDDYEDVPVVQRWVPAQLRPSLTVTG